MNLAAVLSCAQLLSVYFGAKQQQQKAVIVSSVESPMIVHSFTEQTELKTQRKTKLGGLKED